YSVARCVMTYDIAVSLGLGTKTCWSPLPIECLLGDRSWQSSELFHDTLKDIYFAEKKILTALPKMAKAAQSEELKEAFQKHESETEEQVSRLEKVFEEIGQNPRGKTCDAIVGLIEEGQEVMKEYKGTPALDAGLL